MKCAYLDTNVLLAIWVTPDPHYQTSRKLLLEIKKGTIQAITSTLTLLEIASVVARQQTKFSAFLKTDLNLSEEYLKKLTRLKKSNLSTRSPKRHN